MSKIYIFNIKSDSIKTNESDSIAQLGLHELICDRRIESSKTVEKSVISILDAEEYKNVIDFGYYWVDD